jgi:hypothetical protein
VVPRRNRPISWGDYGLRFVLYAKSGTLFTSWLRLLFGFICTHSYRARFELDVEMRTFEEHVTSIVFIGIHKGRYLILIDNEEKVEKQSETGEIFIDIPVKHQNSLHVGLALIYEMKI